MKRYQQGQALLILVLALATIMTVVAAVSYRTTTETRITKLQEESVRVAQAADSGLDQGFQLSNNPIGYKFNDVGLGNLPGIDPNGSLIKVSANTSQTNHVTSVILKDGQYMLYLSNYDVAARSFSSPMTSNAVVYYGSTTACNVIALELSLISGNSPYTVKRYIADVGRIITTNATDPDNIGADITSTPKTINGTVFRCRAQVPISTATPAITDARLLIVRVLNNSTTLGFEAASGNLPSQGRTVRSEARSQSGVTKIVQLFQSYPQLAPEFFIPSF